MARGKIPAQTPKVPQDIFLPFDMLYTFVGQLDADLRQQEGLKKRGSTSKVSTTVLATDRDFSIFLRPFAKVAYRLRLVTSANVSFQLTGPAAPGFVALRRNIITTAGAADTLWADYPAAATALTTAAIVTVEGVIYNGATEGWVDLKWAQNASNVTASTIYAGSDVTHSSIDQ